MEPAMAVAVVPAVIGAVGAVLGSWVRARGPSGQQSGMDPAPVTRAVFRPSVRPRVQASTGW